VLGEDKPSAENQTFTVVAIYDPHFETPWLLACPRQLSGADFWGFYHDRWPPNIWWVLTANLSLPKRVAIVFQSYPYWLGLC
jgi:hypothetical protein